MNWFIDDYDQTQIYITDLWREFYIPKFRIAMSVEEPYLFLYWNDRERGEGGDERLLQIDYQDVVDGYGGYVDNPSSATDLMATINEMIVSGFVGTGGGDVSYPIPVDGVTITGGTGIGDPLVAVGSASSITELTPELFADGNITGIGSNQFLDDLGYSDGTAAIAWPLTAANYPGGLTAADFTLDTVCWQEMFYYAKVNGAAYMTTSIDYATDDVGKSYYVNKTLYLPRIKDVASNINSLSFIIDFKGTRVRNSSGGDMILFDRYPDDQDDADTLISYQYCFWNGVLRGNGGVTDDDTLIRLGSTSRSEFRNMNFEHAGVIVDLQFCLEPVFDNINISDYGEYGLKIWNGQWTGAGFFNSQSNIPSINHFRSYNSPGNTPVATIYCNGNHTVSGDVWTFEGDVGCEHHFFYDNDGSAGVNLGSIGKIYMEFAGCSRAAIRVRAGKGQFIIRDFRSSIDETDMPVIIEGDNDRDPTSSIHLFIEKSAYGTIDSLFRAVGDPDYPVVWCVEDVRMNDNTQLNVAANFETGVIANSYVPDDDHVRFISTDARGSVVWVDGVTITGQGTEADPFVAGSAAVADGDYGDITVSVSGATWTIDNNAVTTAKIIDDAVTFAKMQDIATDRLLGRDTAASGNVEEVSLDSATLAFTGSTSIKGVKEVFHISSQFVWNPVDSTTVYFSGAGSTAQSANVLGKRIIPKAGTLMQADIMWGATSTAGSGEDISLYVRLNDTTDYLVATIGNTNADKRFVNTAMNSGSGITFNGTTDFYMMKCICPAWASNPTAVQWQGTIYFILT